MEKKKSKFTLEFNEKAKLIEMDMEASKIKHKLKMDEYVYIRESDRLHHEKELERGRIKSAEIRKNIHLKQGYSR